MVGFAVRCDCFRGNDPEALTRKAIKALKSSKAWLPSELSGYQFRHILFLPMRQGVHGVHLEPACWVVDCRLRCWLVKNQCSFRTAVCSCYLEQFYTALVSRKTFKHGLLSFLQIQSYYTDSKLLWREFFALSFAHTCATMTCAAFSGSGSGKLSTEEEGGHKSAHVARVTGTLPSPKRVVTVTR